MQLLCQEYLLDYLSRRKKLAPEKNRPRLIHGYRNDSIYRPPSDKRPLSNKRPNFNNFNNRPHSATRLYSNNCYNIRVRILINRGSSSFNVFNCSQTNGNATVVSVWVSQLLCPCECINSSNEWHLLLWLVVVARKDPEIIVSPLHWAIILFPRDN